MDPRHLTQLAVIVELGSISRAAERLNLSQPTLSRSVRILEERVGSPLLRRERHGVTPTAIGLQLAQDGRAILDHSRHAQVAAQVWKQGLQGELRLGVEPLLAAAGIGDLLSRSILDNWPYSLSVVAAPAARLLEDLSQGRLDVAIAPARPEGSDAPLMHEALFPDRLSVFAAANDPLHAIPGPKDPALLADRHWIDVAALWDLFGSTRALLDIIGLPQVVPKIRVAADVAMLSRIVTRVQGLCFLPSASAAYLQDHHGLWPVPITTALQNRDMAVWSLRSNAGTQRLVHFRSRLAAFVSGLNLT